MEVFQLASDRFVEFVPSLYARVALASFASLGIILLINRLIFGRSSKQIPPKGKVVVVTGCDTPGGFGTETVKKLHELGYVVFAGCLDPEQARQGVYSDLKDSNRFILVKIDVTDQAQVDSCMEVVKKWLQENPGHYVHSVVNNAGILSFSPTEWYKMENFIKVFDVNCFGVVRVTKAFLPLIRQGNGDGRIVVISSLASEVCLPDASPYCGSKAAVLMMSNCLRAEVADLNIKVSVVCPDFYRTKLITDNDRYLASMKQHVELLNKETYAAYGGDAALDRLTKLFSKNIPSLSKSNITPVIDSIVNAVVSVQPKRVYHPTGPVSAFLRWLNFYCPGKCEELLNNFLKK